MKHYAGSRLGVSARRGGGRTKFSRPIPSNGTKVRNLNMIVHGLMNQAVSRKNKDLKKSMGWAGGSKLSPLRRKPGVSVLRSSLLRRVEKAAGLHALKKERSKLKRRSREGVDGVCRCKGFTVRVGMSETRTNLV